MLNKKAIPIKKWSKILKGIKKLYIKILYQVKSKSKHIIRLWKLKQLENKI